MPSLLAAGRSLPGRFGIPRNPQKSDALPPLRRARPPVPTLLLPIVQREPLLLTRPVPPLRVTSAVQAASTRPGADRCLRLPPAGKRDVAPGGRA